MLNPLEWQAPWFVVAVGLFVIVMLRANATYWLGRLASGARSRRVQGLVSSPGYRRAVEWLNRWGAPVVTLCFLTVGVQTLVNLAAGITRMPLRRYLPAVVLGCLIWAVVYATVGFAGYEAFRALHAYSPPLAWAVIGAAALGLVAFGVVQVRAARHGAGALAPSADDGGVVPEEA